MIYTAEVSLWQMTILITKGLLAFLSEHVNDLLCSVSERWGAVVQRSMEARQEMLPAPNAVARDMFACIWGPVTAAIYSGVVEQLNCYAKYYDSF